MTAWWIEHENLVDINILENTKTVTMRNEYLLVQ